MTSFQDEVHKLACEIIAASYYPERISAQAHAIAEDIRARADEIERERQRKAEALTGACRTAPKIWGQWLRRR
jgi:type II secretory pathway component PulL